MRVLCACEESQRVCISFRERGHVAFSADLQDCSGGHPEWHIRGDVIPLLSDCWDMIIAFPPCTYLSKVGAPLLFPGGNVDLDRLEKQRKAVSFFYKIWNAPAEKICIENPVPFRSAGLPPESCRINPWEFGEPYTKRTYLWLKGLPVLMPTALVVPVRSWVSGTRGGFASSPKMRSLTFWGVARAMADQWG